MYRPWTFLILLCGIVLFASWFSPVTRAVWDQLDYAVFTTFNGSLGAGAYWQIFWAVLNFRGADMIPAAIMLGLFAHHAWVHKREKLLDYAGIGLAMAIYVVATVQIAHTVFDDLDRQSPSVVFADVYLLSELVPWAHPKDQSGNSFPGDHGTVLLMVSMFLWYYGSRAYGLIGFAVTCFFVLPRLFSGAHWFTDIAVGSVGIACVAMSLAIGTPFHRWLSTKCTRIIRPLLTPLAKKL